MVFTGWLFELLSGSSNGRLVLATVLSYLSAYLPACLPVSVVRFNSGGTIRINQSLRSGRPLLWPFAGGTFGWWLSGVPP